MYVFFEDQRSPLFDCVFCLFSLKFATEPNNTEAQSGMNVWGAKTNLVNSKFEISIFLLSTQLTMKKKKGLINQVQLTFKKWLI